MAVALWRILPECAQS